MFGRFLYIIWEHNKLKGRGYCSLHGAALKSCSKYFYYIAWQILDFVCLFLLLLSTYLHIFIFSLLLPVLASCPPRELYFNESSDFCPCWKTLKNSLLLRLHFKIARNTYNAVTDSDVGRDGFRERGAVGHLNFWDPTEVWRMWPFVWKAWKYTPLKNVFFVVPTLVLRLRFSGSQTFSDRVPLVGAVLSTRTTLFQEKSVFQI